MCEDRMKKHISHLVERYPQLSVCQESIFQAFEIMKNTYEKQGKVLIAGNGGSAADAEHIVGELMKGFKLPRPLNPQLAQACIDINPEMGELLKKYLQGGLPAIALSGHTALTTAFMNDQVPELTFAQQVNGFGVKNDTFWGISTSGNSKNVIFAAIMAKAKGLPVIGLTGAKESKLSELSDVCIKVPETETYKIQEFHLPVYHCLCLMLEDYFFGK